ncbi:MAG TPA: alpha/beta fold hydrolase [Telluria sp.]|jgi:alpha/beta superfamily hydrolase
MTATALPPTSRTQFAGPAGTIEALVDAPLGSMRGIAIVAHPHPLEGGTALHKIPAALARLFQRHGWLAVRPNFRGVGATEGSHDAGNGETEDTLAVIEALRRAHPDASLALAGFSFGAFVQARAARRLLDAGSTPACTVLVGIPSGTVTTQRSYDTPDVPADALVIHGEADPVVPLASVMDWARPQHLPVVVMPGANHFLTGYLTQFTAIVERHLLSLS